MNGTELLGAGYKEAAVEAIKSKFATEPWFIDAKIEPPSCDDREEALILYVENNVDARDATRFLTDGWKGFSVLMMLNGCAGMVEVSRRRAA